MTLRRSWEAAVSLALAAVVLLPACNRRKSAEANPIVPSFQVNRDRAPLGSAIEITYTWTAEPGAKKLPQDYRALVHFLDSHGVMLFEDDHMPIPPTTAWEPGQTYSYQRTKFIPIYPYVGEVEVRMGLYPHPGRGERPALTGEDRGMREYQVAKVELLPRPTTSSWSTRRAGTTPRPTPRTPAWSGRGPRKTPWSPSRTPGRTSSSTSRPTPA